MRIVANSTITTKRAYRAALKRIDALLPLVDDEHYSLEDPNVRELEEITSAIEAYEAIHYPIQIPNIAMA